MFRLTPFIFLWIFLATACGENSNEKKYAIKSDTFFRKKDSTVKNPVAAGYGLEIDSNAFYPVYELSPNTQALVLTADYECYPGYQSPPLDSMLHDVLQSGRYFEDNFPDNKALVPYVDTSGPFALMKLIEIPPELDTFLRGEFFIICTKGVVKRKMKEALVSFDLCQTSFFAFRFAPVDTVKYGHPLLASRTNYLARGNFPAAEDAIALYHDSITKTIRDYLDTFSPVVFGRSDSLYFTYHDDFRWPYMEQDTSCYLPGRMIYVIRAQGAEAKQWEELDLFGAPCD